MKIVIPLLALLVGANAASVVRRDPQEDRGRGRDDDRDWDDKDWDKHGEKDWHKKVHIKTKDPFFFSLVVDDYCSYPRNLLPAGSIKNWKKPCPLKDYAIRLEKGKVIATPYNQWWDADLPVMFVDDDTQMYTVSKEPVQFYVDEQTAELRYTNIGWVPPSGISVGFHHMGTNPIKVLHPSSAFLTWPSTFGTSSSYNWQLCAIGGTKQFQVYADFSNFPFNNPQGVIINRNYCSANPLAAINADPWKKGDKDHDDWHTDDDDDHHHDDW